MDNGKFMGKENNGSNDVSRKGYYELILVYLTPWSVILTVQELNHGKQTFMKQALPSSL